MSSEKVHPQNGYYSDPMHSARVLFGWYLILLKKTRRKKTIIWILDPKERTRRPEITITNLYTINPHKTNENHRETPTSNSRNMLNFQSSIILKFQNHQPYIKHHQTHHFRMMDFFTPSLSIFQRSERRDRRLGKATGLTNRLIPCVATLTGGFTRQNVGGHAHHPSGRESWLTPIDLFIYLMTQLPS